nr:BPK_HP1_G0058400.mRNA.1.CDS.1 [Saccharomyces cerevisiae]
MILGAALVFFWRYRGWAFYSGFSKKKICSGFDLGSDVATLVGILQWYFWGYSLAFSKTATNKFIGNLIYLGLETFMANFDDSTYPELIYAIFQMMFMCVALSIIVALLAKEVSFFHIWFFLFVFATLVYCPITY